MKRRLVASFFLIVGLSFLCLGAFGRQQDELWKLVKLVSETCIVGIP